METLNDTQVSDIQFSEIAIRNLRRTTPWMKFIAILGYIFGGLLTIAAIGIFVAGTARISQSMKTTILIVYMLLGVVYIWLSVLIHQQASAIKTLITQRNTPSLEKSFAKQKAFWVTLGVMLMLTLLPLLVLVGFAFANDLKKMF